MQVELGSSSSTPTPSSSSTPTPAVPPPRFNAPADNAGGALDVIVVVHADGSLRSSEWHVTFHGHVASRSHVHLSINGSPFDGEFALRVLGSGEPATFGPLISPSNCAPPEELLASLATSKLLHDGRNELRYTVGNLCVRAFLYLWRVDAAVVVFDIDGTVTLNDAAGHAANLFASDTSPTHAGVCQLVSELHARGYALVYLTSRPLLGAAGIERTRRFLFEVAVDVPSGARMPLAPVLTTTHRDMFGALADELGGKSKVFKANALKQLRDAFTPPPRTLGTLVKGAFGTTLGRLNARFGSLGVAPAASAEGAGGGLYAGFGNREKDALAYLSAGVPPERVLIIDPSSRLAARAATLLTPTLVTTREEGKKAMDVSDGNGGAAVAAPVAEQHAEHRSHGGGPHLPFHLPHAHLPFHLHHAHHAHRTERTVAAPPSWHSYLGMLASDAVDVTFPRRVSASNCEQRRRELGIVCVRNAGAGAG